MLTRYKCFKEVLAGKISAILEEKSLIDPTGCITTLVLDTGDNIDVTPLYVEKHQPKVGGYFVQYESEEGEPYCSFSPAKVFEGGYIAMPERKYDHPVSPILKFFDAKHLPIKFLPVTTFCASLAMVMERMLPPGAEKSAGLRKLLEAKDCFVRSLVEALS